MNGTLKKVIFFNKPPLKDASASLKWRAPIFKKARLNLGLTKFKIFLVDIKSVSFLTTLISPCQTNPKNLSFNRQ